MIFRADRITEMDISDGQLFADLQVSLTEIILIHLLRNQDLRESYDGRFVGNQQISDSIISIMEDRFSDEDIVGFLENGYPRQVDLRGLL